MKKPPLFKLFATVRQCSLGLAVLLAPLSVSQKTIAAERVYASYSALERSVAVASLEAYAKKGIINDDLSIYTQYLKPPQMAQLRRALLQRINLSPVAISQFLYTDQGEMLLQKLGEIVKTETREEGSLALRGALILAADDPQGLTLLTFLQKFPTRSIRIDLAQTLDIAGQLEGLVTQTNRANAAVAEKSRTTAIAFQPPANLAQFPDLRRRGQISYRKTTRTFFDLSRARMLKTDIYIPSVQKPAAVIIISHGLGSDSGSFQYLANQLASYGFGVIVPNHPGSDAKQLRSLLGGRASEIADSQELINRPLDIKYILDEMERLSNSDSEYKSRLNLQQVGIVGQSLGGYTALAVAGAPINYPQLDKNCAPGALNQSWNISLLLQCEAAKLNRAQSNFRDERIKAAIAVNPITSSIFGQASISQIKIPVMIVASSDDTVAPSFSEQIQPFTWLTNLDKYLVLLKGGTHFSTIGSSSQAPDPVPLPSRVIGQDPSQARRYLNILSLAFFKTYVGNISPYRAYLNSFYIEKISTNPLGLSLIQSLTPTELQQALDGNTTTSQSK